MKLFRTVVGVRGRLARGSNRVRFKLGGEDPVFLFLNANKGGALGKLLQL